MTLRLQDHRVLGSDACMKTDPESGDVLAHWSEVPMGARVAARSAQGIERADVVRFLRARAEGETDVVARALRGYADQIAQGMHRLDPAPAAGSVEGELAPLCKTCGGPLAGAATGLHCPSKGCPQG